MKHTDILNLVRNSGIDPYSVCDQVGFIKVLQKHGKVIEAQRCSTICHTLDNVRFLKSMVLKTPDGVVALSGHEGWSDIQQHEIARAQQACLQETGAYPTQIEFSHETFPIDIFQQDTFGIEKRVEAVLPRKHSM